MTSSEITVVLFALLGASVVVVDTVGRRDTARWPTVGDVFSALTATSVGRFMVMLGWWWLGWHFFVR